MDNKKFEEFLSSTDTLRVYKEDRLLFSSKKNMLMPIIEYIDACDGNRDVVIFDKMVGNAAALLAIKAGCTEVFSPIGSEAAVKTLERYSIKYHLTQIVPRVKRPDGQN